MKFLIDEQLPPALTHWIEARGHVAEHVSFVGLSGRPDKEIVRYATTERAVIITKDDDFAAIIGREREIQIVWLRVGNVRNPVLTAMMDALWAPLMFRLESGERLIELSDPQAGMRSSTSFGSRST